jgi:enoyl-[acyl-carrier protein] reductase II
MFEGDLVEGELEIGQVASYVRSIKPAAQILNEIWQEFLLEKERISRLNF